MYFQKYSIKKTMENIASYSNVWGVVANEMESDLDSLIFKKNQTIYIEGSSPLGVYF